MLVAGGAAYAVGRPSAGPREGGDQEYEEPPAAPPPPAPTSGASDVDALQQLAQLHSSGALTDEEFAAEKAKILGT